MLIPYLISRIQNARITGTNPKDPAGVAIDIEILKHANISEFQKVELCDHNSGITIKTYVTAAESGSAEVRVTGPLAEKIKIGGKVTITAYALLDERELNSRRAAILFLDKNNGVEREVSGKL